MILIAQAVNISDINNTKQWISVKLIAQVVNINDINNTFSCEYQWY